MEKLFKKYSDFLERSASLEELIEDCGDVAISLGSVASAEIDHDNECVSAAIQYTCQFLGIIKDLLRSLPKEDEIKRLTVN